MKLALHVNEVGSIVYAYDVPSTTHPGAGCQVTCRRIDYAPDMGKVRLKLDEVDGYGWFEPEEIRAMYHAGWLGPADSENARLLMQEASR